MDRRTFLKIALGGSGIFAAAAALKYDVRKLNISVHVNHKIPTNVRPYAEAIMAGMRACGLAPYYAGFNHPCDSDIAVMWGWKQHRVIEHAQERKTHLLFMERGFIQPRTEWTSLAFDGLNGFGRFTPAPDNGERWNRYFAQHLQPWRRDKKGYALLIGQVPDDPALHGLDIYRWLQQMADACNLRKYEVVYRPHPDVVAEYKGALHELLVPNRATLSKGTLAEDLAGAAFTVIFSSNTAVESVLAGVPAVIMDKGSIAWEMGSHDLDQPFYYPDRTQWCHDLAWRQWTMAELADGSAWKHTSKAIRL